MRRITSTALAIAGTIAGVMVGHGIAAPAVSTTYQPSDTVVVVDATQGAWHGVDDAVRSWSASPLLDVVVRRQCDLDSYCVVLQPPAEYDRDWVGWWQPISRHVSYVQLNAADQRAQSADVQAWTVCHELSHALGVQHPVTDLASCSEDQLETGTPTATQYDRAMLAAVADNGTAQRGTALWYFGHQR